MEAFRQKCALVRPVILRKSEYDQNLTFSLQLRQSIDVSLFGIFATSFLGFGRHVAVIKTEVQ